MAKPVSIEVWNPNGKYRVVSTKPMPGTRWINLLIEQDCRVEVSFIFFFVSLPSPSLLKILLFDFVHAHSDMHGKENYTFCGRYHCSDWQQVRRSDWTGIVNLMDQVILELLRNDSLSFTLVLDFTFDFWCC